MLGKVVLRYLEGVDDPLVNNIRGLLNEGLIPGKVLSERSRATLQEMCQEVGSSFRIFFALRSLVQLWLCYGWPCIRRSSPFWLTPFNVLQVLKATNVGH